MRKPEIKAGLTLDIVLENELQQPNAHHLKAVVYEYDNKNIVISQTSPPLPSFFTGRRALMSFLVAKKDRLLRFGFYAELMNRVQDYQISSGQTVEAWRCRQTDDLEPTDFRMYFRVKPPSNADLSLFIEEQKVSLLDISIGGAQFTYPNRRFFRARDEVKFKLVIGGDIFQVEGMVRHVREADQNATNRNIQYVSVEFRYRDKDLEAALGKAILNIERSLLSEGKI